MPRLKSVDELLDLQQRIKSRMEASLAKETVITVGMGTCGQAAGANDVYRALQRELESRKLNARLRSVGCIGMCVREPLVDIQLPGQRRITYANISPAQVPRLIEEHVIGGRVVVEWALGVVPPEW